MSILGNKIQMFKKSARDKSPPLTDDERCTHNDGKQSRCRHRRAADQSICDYHLQYQPNKNPILKMFGKRDGRSAKLKSARDFYESRDEYSNGEDTSPEKKNDMDQRVDGKRTSISLEKREKVDNKGKQIIDLSDAEYRSEKNDMDQRVGEKRKSISLEKMEKIENVEKQIVDLYGTEYKSDGEKKNDMDQRVGVKRKSISLEMEKIDNKGKQIIDLSNIEYKYDSEENNDFTRRISVKRKSVSLEKVEKVENKGKQISDMSSTEYKSSTQKGLDSKEKPELSKKIFKGEDPQMCNQCQRNDEGKVVSCMGCNKERFCVPCTKCRQNPMDSDTETRKEEKRTFSDLELEIKELETKLLEDKIRYEHLQTENDTYKSELLNLKNTVAAMEKENNKFRKRNAQNVNEITEMFGMMASHEKDLAGFMKKFSGRKQ